MRSPITFYVKFIFKYKLMKKIGFLYILIRHT